MKKTLYDQLMEAYEDCDDQKMRALMDGYSPAKMRIAYRVVEAAEGYTAACQARRGEHTYVGRMMGICD